MRYIAGLGTPSPALHVAGDLNLPIAYIRVAGIASWLIVFPGAKTWNVEGNCVRAA